MRKTLMVALVALSSMAYAQTFFESFDTGPAGFSNGATGTFGNSAGGDAMAFASGTWHALNNSSPLGVLGWFSSNSVFAPNSGTGQLNANFDNTTGGTGTIDNYMMSPVRTFNNGDTISFFTRTPTGSIWPDRTHLKLSLNGASTNVADFSTTLVSVNSGLGGSVYPEVWTLFGATISGLGGPTSGRFAFNYNVTDGGPTGVNSNFIGIDDVTYTAIPEPGTMIALGLGISALAARRRRKLA